jgi:hypothetical protein
MLERRTPSRQLVLRRVDGPRDAVRAYTRVVNAILREAQERDAPFPHVP